MGGSPSGGRQPVPGAISGLIGQGTTTESGFGGGNIQEKLTDIMFERQKQLGKLAGGKALTSISEGQLTPEEQAALAARQNLVEEGYRGAGDVATEAARSQATARGMFSSAGAISDEAARLAQIEQQRAGELADIEGQRADLVRSGILQGSQLRGQLLTGALGGAQQTFSTIGQLQQQQEQARQAQQQQRLGGVLGLGQLAFSALGI